MTDSTVVYKAWGIDIMIQREILSSERFRTEAVAPWWLFFKSQILFRGFDDHSYCAMKWSDFSDIFSAVLL